jgi:hypothetical protein
MSASNIRGLLIRVGIDSACGSWNAPVDMATKKFVYVPIPESKPIRRGLKCHYNSLIRPLAAVRATLPATCANELMHLDPDFHFLTYGDQGSRAQRIRDVLGGGNGFIAFYASLRDVTTRQLVNALIGFYQVYKIVEAADFPKTRWHQNAHTRRKSCEGDVVVLADKGNSGRLAHCIVIGQFRDRAHRVDKALLKAWGGLTVRDGYIQRSARLPEFLNPGRFLEWFHSQQPKLLQVNNPL